MCSRTCWQRFQQTVSVLFNEPKLLKLSAPSGRICPVATLVSVLFNEPKLLKCIQFRQELSGDFVSVLFNEPKLLKSESGIDAARSLWVSVLFNEPKLLKLVATQSARIRPRCFSALQRAEIAEILFGAMLQQAGTAFQCSSTSRNC